MKNIFNIIYSLLCIQFYRKKYKSIFNKQVFGYSKPECGKFDIKQLKIIQSYEKNMFYKLKQKSVYISKTYRPQSYEF